MKKSMNSVFAVLLAFSVMALTGCQSQPAANANTNVLDTSPEDVLPMSDFKQNAKVHKAGFQLEMPKEGEEIAVVSTNMGEFKIRFFPDEAPLAVYSFKKHSQQGYYDGLIFHRVIQNFMVQGGDPEGTGRGGESVWGQDFNDEFTENLFNITGAVAMANSGANTNGSQFFVNNNPEVPDWDYFKEVYDTYYKSAAEALNAQGGTMNTEKLTDDIKKAYEKAGGNWYLDHALSTSLDAKGTGYTVFGQVFEGMEVINKISAVKTNSDNKPDEDVVIQSIKIVPYGQ